MAPVRVVFPWRVVGMQCDSGGGSLFEIPARAWRVQICVYRFFVCACSTKEWLTPLSCVVRSDEVLRGQGSQKSVKVKSPRGAQRVEWSM